MDTKITVKQMIGVLFILTVLGSTFFAVMGIWGIFASATVWKLVGTLAVVAVGLGVCSPMLDQFFPDKKKEKVNE